MIEMLGIAFWVIAPASQAQRALEVSRICTTLWKVMTETEIAEMTVLILASQLDCRSWGTVHRRSHPMPCFADLTGRWPPIHPASHHRPLGRSSQPDGHPTHQTPSQDDRDCRKPAAAPEQQAASRQQSPSKKPYMQHLSGTVQLLV